MISQENNAESPTFEKAFFFLGGGGGIVIKTGMKK